MGLETATYVTDLVSSNPPSSDLRSQGDDHLRLLKAVLQTTFPTASKAWYNPTSQAKSADFTIVAADMNKTFLVDTTAGSVTATLPTLAAGDAGWDCWLVKTNTGVNPMFVLPASGNVQSGALTLTKTRRSIPGFRVQCLWSGTTWTIGRAVNLPVGSAIEYHGSALPTGYEWPNGQTLSSSANYPDYNGQLATLVTLDKRGRIGIPLDNLGGSAAGRLAGGIITGTALGNVGGTDTATLSLAQIPTGINSSATQTITVNPSSGGSGYVVPFSNATWIADVIGSGPRANGMYSGGSLGFTTTFSGSNTISVASNNTGGGAHSNLQPSIMVAQILLVE